MSTSAVAPAKSTLSKGEPRFAFLVTPRRVWQEFHYHKGAMLALAYLVFMVVVAILGRAIAPYDPAGIDLKAIFQGPSWAHWLGTDANGRDVLSRMIMASRASLLASVQAVGLGVMIGVTLGLICGYVGGLLDMLIMRFIDAMLSIPGLLTAMGIIGMLGPGLNNAMIALSVMMTPTFVRLARAQALIVVEETYVEAARSVGAGDRRIVFRHILPNIASPVLVQMFMAMGGALLAEGAMSYLGLSVQPPNASWGSLLRESFSYIVQTPGMIFVPGCAIMLAVLSFNVVGDGLRSALLGNDDGGAW